MNRPLPRRGVFVDAGPRHSVRPAGDARATLQLAEGLRRDGWTLVFCRGRAIGKWRPLLARRRADLVVAVLGEDRPRSVLWSGAVVARWACAPLVVVEDEPGSLAELRKSRSTRLAILNVVTRSVVRPVEVPARFEAPLLVEIGAGPGGSPGDGVAPLTLDDLDAVVRLHQQAFADSAMTQLGARVVERYYRWQFIGDHPHPFAVGAWRDRRLVGFVFGGVRKDAVSGFVRRFFATIAFGAIAHPAGVRRLNPLKLASVVRLIVRRPKPAGSAVMASEPEPPAPAATSFGILSIAVDPGARGTGIADDLMAAAEAAAAEVGLHEMNLTVDPDNARAIRFYERTGWQRVAEEPTWSGRMAKRI